MELNWIELNQNQCLLHRAKRMKESAKHPDAEQHGHRSYTHKKKTSNEWQGDTKAPWKGMHIQINLEYTCRLYVYGSAWKSNHAKDFRKKNIKSRDFATKIDRFHRKLALIRQISRYFSVESTMPITYNLFILYKYHIIFTLSQHRDNNFVAKMASVLQCVHW